MVSLHRAISFMYTKPTFFFSLQAFSFSVQITDKKFYKWLFRAKFSFYYDLTVVRVVKNEIWLNAINSCQAKTQI